MNVNISQIIYNKKQKIKNSYFYYILNNTITGKFVICFWIVYLIQFIFYPIFIGSIMTESGQISTTWMSIFTVSTENPYYFWTYIISLFSHGSIIHILFNSIVLLSFGIIIESDLGKKKFIKLFFIFGLSATVAQIFVIHIADIMNMPIYMPVNEFMLLGASGAISGYIGMVCIKIPHGLIKIIIAPFFSFKLIYGVILFTILSISLIFYFGVLAFNIAHTAHIFGLIIGIMYGIKIYNTSNVKYEIINLYYKIIY